MRPKVHHGGYRTKGNLRYVIYIKNVILWVRYSFKPSIQFLTFLKSTLILRLVLCFHYLKGHLELKLSLHWPAKDPVEFYVPLVPVFVLPGSVSDGVPPSDRCSKQ